MKWENATVLDTLRELNSVETVEGVLATFTNFSKDIGFKDYFVSQLTSPSSPQLRRSMTYTNWPDELLAERADQLQVLRDPVVQYGLRTKFPFRWEQAYKFADKVGMKMAQRVWDFGLTDGVMFLLRRPGVPFGAVTLAGDTSDISPAEMAELELAVIHTFSALERLEPPAETVETPKLSPQEVVVLQYAAAGKTTWETGVILSISENSVRDAIKRARHKLDAVNIQHAVSKAIAEDLIIP